MDQPWYFIGFGALFGAFGGFLTWMGFTYDHAVMVLRAGLVIDCFASLALFVGLIALGVEVGMRATRR